MFVFNGISVAQSETDSLIGPARDSLLVKDSTVRIDSVSPVLDVDSVSRMPQKNEKWATGLINIVSTQQFSWELAKHNPYFGFSAPATPVHSSVRQFTNRDLLFYLLVGLLLVCAFLKASFSKYFNDLFRLFFRATLKQRQIKEQLMQTPLPSLLLNGFFVVSTGLYITFLLEHFGLNPLDNFWLLYFYCCLGLSVIYLVKFLGLKLSGWVFNLRETTDAYIFIVFIINKMIGILILPFLILLAFTSKGIYSIGITLSYCMVGALLIYRFILTFSTIRNQVKVNPFHFFLYLCAFEVAPLLLIYKALMLLFFNITA